MSNQMTVTDPFSGGVSEIKKIESASVLIGQERAIAEVKATVLSAKQFPRDEAAAMDSILMACCRPTLAEQAVYSYPKGGQQITGPSIRLAEAIARAWGNIQFGINEIDQRDGVSTVEAFAWDAQTNTRQTKTFQVSHLRHTKKGAYVITDPRDIYEMVANQGARRMRNCILSLIPSDVVEAALEQVSKTLEEKTPVTQERLDKMISFFEARGVSKEMIKNKIMRNVDVTMPPAVLASLFKIATALKDGYSKPEDHFEFVADEQSMPKEETKDSSLGVILDALIDGISTCSNAESIDDFIEIHQEEIAKISKGSREQVTAWAVAASKQRKLSEGEVK